MSTLPGDSSLAGASAAPHGRKTTSARPHRPRRAFGDAVLHAPQTLRALVRADEIWLVVLAAFVGCGAGIAVWAMTETTQLIHELLFQISPGQRLSAMVELDPIRTVAVPTLGGLLIGLLGLGFAYYRPRRAVDPIEANALYGGRMSLNDSLIVVVQTILSNGVGASVGLEAGYTQGGSALASRLGRMFRVRRNDLRLLVGCGAAAAIAGAFNAPLTGAFYAFELVIGTYSLGTFAPVAVAAIVAVAVVQALGGAPFDLLLQVPSRVDALDYIPILALGMFCALVGIAIMRGVTLTEELFRRSARSGLAASDDRRTCRGRAGTGNAGGPVVRPRRARDRHRGAVHADPRRLAGGAEVDRLGDLDRLRLPWRPVLRLAVPRRAGRQAVRRHAGAWSAPPTPSPRSSAPWSA